MSDNPKQHQLQESLIMTDEEKFKAERAECYKKNEELKNKMFLGCFGLAGIMLSAVVISNSVDSNFANVEWGKYAAQTISVMLAVFGFHAISIALSIEALSESRQFFWFIRRGEDGCVSVTSYKRLILIAKIIDALCLGTLAVWSIYMAVRIAVASLCL